MMFESSQFDSTPSDTAGFVSTQTADRSPSAAKSRDVNPMHPVTVKQIAGAQSSDGDKLTFLIDGVSVYNVKLVGMAFEKAATKAKATFVLDDGTGRISCIKWIHDSQDEDVEELTNGAYVRVHGYLNTNQGKKQLVVYGIRPLKDYHEVAYHFIECTHAHRCKTRLQKNSPATLATSTFSPATPKTPNNLASSTAGSAKTPSNGDQAVASSHISQEHVDKLEGIHAMVMEYLQLPSSLALAEQEGGIHVDQVAQKLNISQEKIIEIFEHLSQEGLVYSTIDEYRYKCVDS